MLKSTKIILGLNTLIPLAIIFAFGIYFWNFIVIFDKDMSNGIGILGYGAAVDVMALYLICLILSFPIILFYIFHIKRNIHQKDNRKFWVLSVIFFPVPTLQLYWYFKIWKDVS